MRRCLAALAAAAAFASGADAEITRAEPDGFALHFEMPTDQARDAAWATLIDIGAWWAGEHTYSGEAVNLFLIPSVNGCWCEAWDGGEAAHGHVVAVLPESLLRLDAPLGPLQGMGVSAALTIALADGADGGTLYTADYVVSGSSISGLDAIAPAVDAVLGAQLARLSGGEYAPASPSADAAAEADAAVEPLAAAAAAPEPEPAAEPAAEEIPPEYVPDESLADDLLNLLLSSDAGDTDE